MPKGIKGIQKGQIFTKEHRDKIALSKKNFVPWNKGKSNVYSKESLEKMSKARIGVKPIHKKDCTCHLCGGHSPSWNKGLAYNKGHRFKPGELSPSWKGGISKINERERSKYSQELRKWRRSILIRDNFSCCMCHQIGGKLFAHHIKRFIDRIELRTDINNGITLCEDCHNCTIQRETIFEEYFYDMLYFKGDGLS